MKHSTIRFAWHDNKWNGKICQDPSDNFYCVDNHSLLSSRIQRRKDLDKEEKFNGQDLEKLFQEANYNPPCYWCINALGDKEQPIDIVHPFKDTWDAFEEVPPVKTTLRSFSVYTWNFDLSFSSPRGYSYPPNLEDRVKEYISEFEPGKSIVFFYANYSNPITGDEKKYLLLGAAIVGREVDFPKSFDIPQPLYEEINQDKPVFPKITWQFQVSLNPETIVMLPYHEYLDSAGLEKEQKEKFIEELSVKIEDPTVIPHFKYVSRFIPHDKVIYLLYKMKKAASQMEEHGIIRHNEILNINQKIDELLQHAWNERGKYPGFKNALRALLKNDFHGNTINRVLDSVVDTVIENFGSINKFCNEEKFLAKFYPKRGLARRAGPIIRRHSNKIPFLSRFNFSQKQFEKVLQIIGDKFGQFKENPYMLLEHYPYEIEDNDWRIENNDYGLSLFQIDIPLIPDINYVDWCTSYDAHSLERIRALIVQILQHTAQENGDSYLPRSIILDKIQNYPLYYIQGKFEIDRLLLSDYENDPRFKEHYKIFKNIEGEAFYQLKSVEKLEKIIESIVDTLSSKNYSISEQDVTDLVDVELNKFSEKLGEEELGVFENERRALYTKVLTNGLSVISGKAGSGKTSAIINLVRKFSEKGELPIYVFTPTGKASIIIRERLKKVGLFSNSEIKISTIHRFIFGSLIEKAKDLSRKRKQEISHLNWLSYKIFQGNYELIHTFVNKLKGFKATPKVIIIDEASMVDELVLSIFLSMVDENSVKHLILIGDEKQLPPIGIGRPFVDLLYHVKNMDLTHTHSHLTSNLRLTSENTESTKLEILADTFRDEKEPLIANVNDILSSSDTSLNINYFEDTSTLKEILKNILLNKENTLDSVDNLNRMFTSIFEEDEFHYVNLEKLQIITPKRIGRFGTIALNRKVILENPRSNGISPSTKIICEDNQYWNISGNKILGIANGSLGYIKKNGFVKFADVDDLLEFYEDNTKVCRDISREMGKIKNGLLKPKESSEMPIIPAYAITVHKSQGSDFEDVILVISEQSPFITRELLYTGLTRAKNRVHLVIHQDLKDYMGKFLRNVHMNSSIKEIYTLLFGHKKSPFRPYIAELKNGDKISVRSKIEYMIVKALDDAGISFEYEPSDFQQHHIKPDFKILLNEKKYYWEHLGLLNKSWYKNKWMKKLETYRNIGVENQLITTSEDKDVGDVDNSIRNIVQDIKADTLKVSEGSYSKHHYNI